MEVSKEQARKITAKIEAAVKAVLEAEGLDVGKVSTRYGARYEFKITAEAVETGLNGVNLASEYAQTHGQLAALLGVESVPLGTKFVNKGDTFIYAGIAGNRTKYPFAAKDADGRTVFFMESAKAMLNRAAELAVLVA